MPLNTIRSASRRAASALRRVVRGRYYREQELRERGLLVVGPHTYGSPRVESFVGSEARVTIGDYCSIARDVSLVSGGIHPTEWVSTFPFRIRLGLPGAYEIRQRLERMACLRGD